MGFQKGKKEPEKCQWTSKDFVQVVWGLGVFFGGRQKYFLTSWYTDLYSSFTRFLSVTHLCGKELALLSSLIFNIAFLSTHEPNYSNKDGYFLFWSYSQKYHPLLFSLYPNIKAEVAILADSIAAPSASCLSCLFWDSQVVLNLVEHYQLETWESISTLTNAFLIFTESQSNESVFLI